MTTTEIVKDGEAIQKLNERFGQIKARAEALTVKDNTSYLAAAELKLDIQQFLKAVKAAFFTEKEPLKEAVKRLDIQEKALSSPGDALLAAVEEKRKTWWLEDERQRKEEERKANEEKQAEARKRADEERIAREQKAEQERKERERQAEEDRKLREKEIEAQKQAGEIKAREAQKLKREAEEKADRDKQAAKEAEDREKQRAAEAAEIAAKDVKQVKVASSVPTVAGVKNQVYYSAELTDGGARIIAHFMDAVRTQNHERIAFLGRFIMVNEQEVGKFARETKDNEKVMSLLPGVKATSR